MGFFKPNIKKMKAKGDVEGLIEALKHKDWRVQWDAAEALGEVGDARAVEPLIQALKDVYFVESKFQDDERVHVARLLGVGQGMVVIGEVALPALFKIGEPAIESLIQALKDKEHVVRLGAARVLGEIGDARAVEPLIEVLKHKDKEVRESAAEALGELGDLRAGKPLIQALEDKNKKVREAAKEALEKIALEKIVGEES